MSVSSAAELWAQLDAQAKGMEAPVRQAYLDAIADVKASLSDEEVAEVVRTGNLRPILDRLDLTKFKLAVRRSLLASAESTSGLPFGINFDALNTAAIRAIQTSELSLLQGITTEIADGIRFYLAHGLRNGINPVDTARNLREIIGLTPKQVQAVSNYRQLLTGGAKGQPYREVLRRALRDGRFDRTVMNAIEEQVRLKPDQVTRMVQRYEERMVANRADVVARTETMDALYEGQMARWRQAIDENKIEEGELRRFWHTAKDERVCPTCSAIPLLNPTGVAFSQPFQLPDGELMGPTAHPCCRCVVFIRVVFAKGVLTTDLRQMARDLSGLRRAA